MPVVEYTLDFGKVGKVFSYNDVQLDVSPRQCLQEMEEKSDDGWGRRSAAHTTKTTVSMCMLPCYW